MIVEQTNMLLMRTNIQIADRKMLFPEKHRNDVHLCDIKPNVVEDWSFTFSLKSKIEVEVCHIAIRIDRKPLELTFGTIEAFRNTGYMQEGLASVVSWIFRNTNETTIWALVANNPISQHILRKFGFIEDSIFTGGSGIWYRLESSNLSNGIGEIHE